MQREIELENEKKLKEQKLGITKKISMKMQGKM